VKRVGADVVRLTTFLLAFALPGICHGGSADWFGSGVEPTSFLSRQEEIEPGPEYVDLDRYELEEIPSAADPYIIADEWSWQVLPVGLIYSSNLAGMKESRFSANFINIDDEGVFFDASLGTRVGLLRYGSLQGFFPEGFQIDAEGSAQLRLDLEDSVDVRSVDFRGGAPLTFGVGRHRWKFGYYHLSSHLGDEFLLKNPAYPRVNFVRDVFVFGHQVYLTPRFKVYGEVGWAFNKDISRPWEFQVGLDYAPLGPTGIRGAPFFAVNAHLRQEVDFGGSFTAQAGWAWRSDFSTPLLRAGFHYMNGKSNQFAFFNEHEEQVGLAVWYDY
jgi:hypothetical protein